jgi:hypothetical protein
LVTENRAIASAANKIIKLANKRELKEAKSDTVRNSLQNIKLDFRHKNQTRRFFILY